MQNQPTEYISAKVYFQPGNQVRRLQVANSKFKDLIEHLKQLFVSYVGNEHYNNELFDVQVLYLDSEKDWVSVNSEPEWTDALYYFKQEQGESLLRLKVIVVKKQQQKQEQQQQENVAFHRHIVCDGCDKHGITGTRYKCNTCEDFDLCGDCYAKRHATGVHDGSHEFAAIEKPVWRGGGCPWRGGRGRGGRGGCHWGGRRGGWENMVNQFVGGLAQQQPQQQTGENPCQNWNQWGQVINNLVSEFATQQQQQQQEPVVPEKKETTPDAPQQEQQQEQFVPPQPQQEAPKTEQPPQPQASQFNPEQLGSLVNGFLGAFLPQQQQQQQPQETDQYNEQLTALANMGFSDKARNIQLLNTFKGDLSRVVARLLE
jgi:hypothetical protein